MLVAYFSPCPKTALKDDFEHNFESCMEHVQPGRGKVGAEFARGFDSLLLEQTAKSGPVTHSDALVASYVALQGRWH